MKIALSLTKIASKVVMSPLRRIIQTISKSTTVAVLFAVCIAPAIALASTPKLLPHRAVYDLFLDELEQSNLVSGVQGRYVYELSGNRCEGYTTNSRFLLKTTNNIGVENTFDSRSSSYENFENGSFQFFHKSYLNDKVIEESNGIAERNLQELVVELNLPKEIELNLAKDTLFPVEHTIKTISEAKKGTKLMNDLMYDGIEDGQMYYSISTVIGSSDEMSKTEKTVELIDKALLEDNRFWPVVFAYYEQDDTQIGEQTPNFQVSMNLHDNGISSDLRIKYRDYSLIGGLIELESLPVDECDL